MARIDFYAPIDTTIPVGLCNSATSLTPVNQSGLPASSPLRIRQNLANLISALIRWVRRASLPSEKLRRADHDS